MDLLSAKKEIVTKSRQKKGQIFYLTVDQDGEVSISEKFQKGFSHAAYKGGSEIALPEESVTVESKQKSDKTAAAANADKTMAKKATKKAPAKKAAAKTTTSADWGKKVNISIKDMRAGIKKGLVYRDPQGVKQTEKYLATRAKQDFVREGMYEGK